MSIDLKKLENKLDEALSNETNETLTKFLTDKRMSNNKQSMKLYTERQMREMFRMGLANSINEDGALNQFAPIELPSDEELEEQANLITDLRMRSIYMLGAKWMRDLIRGGNK